MSTQKTRAAVPTPPKKRSHLPKAVPAAPPADNMNGEDIAPMTFNMPRSWHTEFKMTATFHKMNMKELMFECFEAWKRQKGE